MTVQSTESDRQGEQHAEHDSQVGVLHLRAPQRDDTAPGNADASSSRTGRRVVWTEDTVDNEGLGKKKSKST